MSDNETISAPVDAAPRSSNAGVVNTIRAHHAELASRLHERTSAMLAATRSGDRTATRDALHEWCRDELIAHIVAEEDTLYSAAQELDDTRLLVRSMLIEHRTLISLIADLALAQDPFETTLAAASAEALFTVHLAKENDLLLPSLDAHGLDLAALLDGMHEILGSRTEASASDSCGCGCAELDVRALPHGQRHEIIFARLDALGPGDALVIVNDHDPKPLRFQTEALWPDRFAWAYREAGPQTWRVAITRAN